MAFSETAPLIAALKLDDKFSGPLKNAGKALGSFDAKLDHTQTRAFRAGQQIGTGIKNTARIAAVGVGILVSQVALGLNSLIKLEQAQAQTNAVLKSTGQVAGQTGADITRLSEKFEALNATVGDEFIRAGANMLLTFTNIRGKAFEPALLAILNLNTAMGNGPEGLTKTAIQVGKALNDPIKGIGNLRRVGVSFTEQQQKQIKLLVRQNDLYGAQQVILRELDTEFKGSFAAQGDTTAGKVAKFADAIEDLQRTLAVGLLPVISNVADALSKTLTDPSVVKGVEAFGKSLAGVLSPKNLAEAGEVLQSVIGLIKSSAPLLQQAAGGMAKIVGGAVTAFRSLPPEIQKLAIAAFAVNKLTGGLVTNIAGGLVGAVLGKLRSGHVSIQAGVVSVNGGVPGGGVAGGVAPAASKLSRIASIATKVFIVGAAIGVFAELKGMLDEQSANNRATQVDQKATLKDFIAQGNRKELQKSLDDLVKIDRDLTNSLTPEAIAYQLDIDGVRDSVHADMDALRAAISKLPQADKESRDGAAVVKLLPDDRGNATAAAIENSLRPGVLARALAAGFHPSAAAIQRTLDNNAAHLEEIVYVATVGKREDRQDTKDRGNAPDAPRAAGLAAVAARALAAGFKPTADQIQRTFDNNEDRLQEIFYANTTGKQDEIQAIKETTSAVRALPSQLRTALGGLLYNPNTPSRPTKDDTVRGPSVQTTQNRRERASGGPVTAGLGYIVGEKGPEWFSPDSNGKIDTTPFKDANGRWWPSKQDWMIAHAMGTDTTTVGNFGRMHAAVRGIFNPKSILDPSQIRDIRYSTGAQFHDLGRDWGGRRDPARALARAQWTQRNREWGGRFDGPIMGHRHDKGAPSGGNPWPRMDPRQLGLPTPIVRVDVHVTAAQVAKSVVIQKRFGPPGGSRESDAGHYGGSGT